MSEDSFAHERALITLLARLNLDFEGRITQFIAARQAGGGANRNRRRRAAGREALRDLDQALGIAILHTEERLANILIPLREAVAARLVVIEAPGFTWYRTDPLLPDFNIEDVAFAFEVGVGESTEALENRISQPLDASEPASGSAFDASEPATGAVPFNATESTDAIAAPSEPIAIAAPSEPIDVDASSTPLRRSRSPPPVSGSAVVPSNPKPPVPRPRVQGARTPVPPAPRPKHLGVRTPAPPVPSSGRPASGYLVSVPKHRARPSQDLDRDYRYEFPSISESFDERVSGNKGSGSSSVNAWTSEQWQEFNASQELAHSATAEPSRPLPLSELHRFDGGLEQVTQWFGRAISLGFRYLLALDQHKVADRSVSQTRDIVRAALAERTIVVVCSFIPDSSFLSHGRNAQALWDPIIADIAEYPRPLPIIVTSKPLYRWGKASCLRHLRDQLWHQQQASFDSWVHVDDRLDIVREIDAERGLRGVHWDPRDRRSLLELCRAEGVL